MIQQIWFPTIISNRMQDGADLLLWSHYRIVLEAGLAVIGFIQLC